MTAAAPARPTTEAASGPVRLHPVDPRVGRPAVPPARRDLFATYLDHMRRRAGVEGAPHLDAHGEFVTRLRIPEHIGDALWNRWVRHYLRYGPDWA